MTIEEKKERLNRYLELWADIEIKLQEIEEFRSRAEKITKAISPMPGGGAKQKQDFSITVDRIIEIQQKIDSKVQLANKERLYIGKIIENVKSPLHRRVLQRKYINGDSFEKIAVCENKNYKYIAYVIHPQALEMINFGNDVTKKGVM